MKIRLLCILFIISVSLCSCGKKNGYIYVDLDSLDKSVRRIITLDGFTVQDVNSSCITNVNYRNCGFNKESFYCMSNAVGFRLDFNTGRLREYCDVPGCIHSADSKYCKYNTDAVAGKISTADGVYKFSGNCLYYQKDGDKTKVLYRNTYHNEYNEKYSNEEEYNDIGGMIKGDTAYITGSYWVQKLSLDTLEASEPIDFNSGYIMCDAMGDSFFFVNVNYELMRADLSKGELQKLADTVTGMMCAEDSVFYVTRGNGTYCLYRMNADGTGEKEKITEDISSQFYVAENHIFYIDYENGVYMCDRNGENRKKLDLSFEYKNGTEYKIENQLDAPLGFLSSSSVEYLFLIDNSSVSNVYNENALFIINKATGEVIPISLGIFYQDSYDVVNPNGSIISY